jgi:hypothetical protein
LINHLIKIIILISSESKSFRIVFFPLESLIRNDKLI